MGLILDFEGTSNDDICAPLLKRQNLYVYKFSSEWLQFCLLLITPTSESLVLHK